MSSCIWKRGKNNNVLFDAHANIQLTYLQIQILYQYIYIKRREEKWNRIQNIALQIVGFYIRFFSTQKQDKNYFTRISTENSLSIDDPNNRNLLELVVLSHLFSFFSAFFFFMVNNWISLDTTRFRQYFIENSLEQNTKNKNNAKTK